MFLKDAAGVQISGARDYVRVISSEQAANEQQAFRSEHQDVLADVSHIQARIRGRREQ